METTDDGEVVGALIRDMGKKNALAYASRKGRGTGEIAAQYRRVASQLSVPESDANAKTDRTCNL